METKDRVSERFLERLLKFSNFVSTIIIFILSFIFFYSLKNILIDKVENISFFLILSVLSLVLIIFFLFSFSFKRVIKINISLVSTLSLILLYSTEIYYLFNIQKMNDLYLNKTPSEKIRIIKAKKFGVPYDLRSRSEYIKDLEKEKITAYPIIPPSSGDLLYKGLKVDDETILPLGGISNILVVGPNENGYWMEFLSDKYGFNNDNKSYNHNKIEICLIGDSFGEGLAVKSNENISSILKKKYKTLNFSKTGNGPLLEYAILREYVSFFKPKIVLWLYFENDLSDLSREMKSKTLNKYIENKSFSQNLLTKQLDIDSSLKEFFDKKKDEFENENNYVLKKDFKDYFLRILLLRDLRYQLNIQVNKNRPILNDELELFKTIITDSENLVSSWGGDLYFVYLPGFNQGFNINKQLRPIFLKENEYRQSVIKIINDLQIDLIDIYSEVFLKHPNPKNLFPFGVYGHYNREGYEIVAKKIESIIDSK